MTDTKQPGAPTAETITTALTTINEQVQNLQRIRDAIPGLKKEHPIDLVVDCSTPAGLANAKTARKAWKDQRVALEKARQAAKRPVLDMGKQIDIVAGSIGETLQLGESNYDGQVTAREAEIAAQAEAARKLEVERKEKHQRAIAVIRSYATMAAGLPSTRIAGGITKLESMRFGAEWEEYASHAVIAQTETLVLLRQMLTQTQQTEAEAEAARIKQEAEDAAREQQRQENERVAAALKAQQDAIEAQRRELQRQQDELNAQRAAMAPPPAPAPAQADDVPAAVAAARATLVERLGGQPAAQPERTASMVTPTELAAAKTPDQPAYAIEMLKHSNEAATPVVPTLKLGEIAAVLGPGITMTEMFVTETLKVKKPAQPAGARGVLFQPSQLNEILEALAELALSKRR